MQELRVRWRGRELSIPVSPVTTVARLRDLLADATGVPPARQTLLVAPRRGRPKPRRLAADEQQTTLRDILGDDGEGGLLASGRPLTMLGTPPDEQQLLVDQNLAVVADRGLLSRRDDEDDVAEEEGHVMTPVVETHQQALAGVEPTGVRNDLHELQADRLWGTTYSSSRTPPTAPPPPHHLRHTYRRSDASASALSPRPFIPALLDRISTETVESGDDIDVSGSYRQSSVIAHGEAQEQLDMPSYNNVEGPVHEDPATNGAALRLEEMDDVLRAAICGDAFIQKHISEESASAGVHTSSTVRVIRQGQFMKAVVQAKSELKMLAVLMFNFGSDDSTVDGSGSDVDDVESSSITAGAVGRSKELLYKTMNHSAVADVLNENFVTFAADLGGLADSGAALLHRLGVHSLPVILLVSDVGSGVAVVDMFAADFFGTGPSASDAIMSRLLDTLATYEGFYESARARRMVSEARDEIISEQDAEFRRAQADDRARAEAAEQARKEEEEREGAERQAGLHRERAARDEVSSAKAALPEEPVMGGARIAVRLPDGRRLDRRFAGHHRIRDVFTWCISLGVRNGSFQLRLSFPRKAFTLDQDGDVTVEAAGLMPTAALNVDML